MIKLSTGKKENKSKLFTNFRIMKRRKVNKKELIDGNVGLVFEKTFAHRDQVIGEIEKKEEDWYAVETFIIFYMNFFNKYKDLFEVPNVRMQ